MSCVVRDACTFRDDAQAGADLLRVEQLQTNQQHQPSPSKGDIRQFRFEAESRGLSPQSPQTPAPVGLQPAQMRELHSAVRELVSRDLQNELEPLRVQLAMQQKQLLQMEYTCQQFAQQAQHTRNDMEARYHERSEKKLEIDPGFEAWKGNQEHRLTCAEHIIKEMSMVQDKHAQRQDALMRCVTELDEKLDKMASSTVALHMQPYRAVPPASMGDADFGFTAPVPEAVGPLVESIMPNTPSCVFTKSGIEVEEFTFEVDRRSGSLGMMLKDDGDILAIDKINNGCVMPVNVGDRIAAVNGVRDDNKAMLEELRRKGRLTLTCERSLSTTV